ncbi:hypothetical protein EYF80_034804 [Liparis tanakae]|uniref:Uncharacterized protein n=1 Tax=Liparis tanakae TaxID=230148 RepID=A0A4Z2GN76_9TELE|nr:hypothetical protein EYF80_034804 [Liparis tanakae]
MNTDFPTTGLNSSKSSSVGSTPSSFLNRASGKGKCMRLRLYKASPHRTPSRKKLVLLSSVFFYLDTGRPTPILQLRLKKHRTKLQTESLFRDPLASYNPVVGL